MILPRTANIVVLASNYNPSIVSKDWLYQKGIVTEPIRNFVHTPVFSLVESEYIRLSVDEQRLEVAARNISEEKLRNLSSIVEKFIDILPETPYKAIGINYHYAITGNTSGLERILAPNKAELSELFSPNYKLGLTVTFEFGKFIVTSTMSPSLKEDHETRISFNFHSDTLNPQEIKGKLWSQGDILKKAEDIVQGICRT